MKMRYLPAVLSDVFPDLSWMLISAPFSRRSLTILTFSVDPYLAAKDKKEIHIHTNTEHENKSSNSFFG